MALEEKKGEGGYMASGGKKREGEKAHFARQTLIHVEGDMIYLAIYE